MKNTMKTNGRTGAALVLASILALAPIFAAAKRAERKSTSAVASKTFEDHVGHGKVNIVDFRGATRNGLPLVFRLEFTTFQKVSSDGFFGPVTRGKMTYSYPRQNNPEVAYNKAASESARFTQGPAYGEAVEYQAREIAPNVFEVHWKEPRRGDTVTHIQDYNRQQILTNITGINRAPIPAEFDALDLSRQLNNARLFPQGNPLTKADFPFISLCGKMSQSLASEKVWEDQMHMLAFRAPK